MLTINLGEFGIYEIDEKNLPLNDALDDVLNLAESGSALSELIPLSIVYYNNLKKEEFVKILKFVIKNTNFSEDIQQNAQTLLNSFYLNEKIKYADKRELQLKEESFTDKILKGFFYLSINDLENARLLFLQCNFDLGLEIVYLIKQEKYDFKNKTLKFLNEYMNGNDTKKLEDYKYMNDNVKFKTNKDFRKTTNIFNKQWIKDCFRKKEFSKWFTNKDALLEMGNFFINEDIFQEIIEFMPDCDGKFFLQGKFYHLQNNFNEAMFYYKKSNLPEAFYNLARIKQESLFDLLCTTQESKNFYIYLSHKLNLPCNLAGELCDFYKALNNPSFFTMRKLIGNKYINQSTVFNNVACYLWLELEKYKVFSKDLIPFSLQKEENTKEKIKKENILSLKEGSSDYLNLNAKFKLQKEKIFEIFTLSKEMDKENENIIENNLNVIKSNSNYDLFINNKESEQFSDELMQINYLRENKKELIDQSNKLIYYLANYKDKPKEAIGTFKEINSVYAINGIGLCYLEKGYYDEAEAIFSKLCLELPYVNINLGNTYLLKKDYASSVNAFKKVPLCTYTFKMLIKLSLYLKNGEIIKEMIGPLKLKSYNKEIDLINNTLIKINILNNNCKKEELKEEELILFYEKVKRRK